jgi:hypothetical protein
MHPTTFELHVLTTVGKFESITEHFDTLPVGLDLRA